jgi:signal transduction histidine kinase/ActR/RegA family two-component response regulator
MNLIAMTEPFRARRLPGYALAVVLSFVALWVRLSFGPTLAGYPFVTFYFAVLLSAFLGGTGPGVVALTLSTFFADYYLIDPVRSLGADRPGGWIAIILFVVVNATVIALIRSVLVGHELQARGEERLRQLNAELQDRVAERGRALEEEMAERDRAESRLRQMQKMESIGQLTGGIAHDFNNMLAIVTGSLDMAKRRLTGDEHPKVAAYIDNAVEGARRAAILTSRLLAFSRRQPLEPQSLDANQLVNGMSELLRRSIGENIVVETALGEGLWRSFADPAQLENALVNLAVNARDAMPGGGRLTILTANADLDESHLGADAEAAPGQYVLIEVRDTGAGMGPEQVERAFEPFYTTKPVGEGTGLGLSQVFGYARQSGGHVEIQSEPGEGTAVRLYLPRHLGDYIVAEERFPAEAAPAGAADRIILVVEDEAQVRRMTVDALRDLGYAVVEAADAAQALAIFTIEPRIDLLFTDMVMPGMSGRQLADRIRAERPATRILFTTGYCQDALDADGGADDGALPLLAKPFTVDQLARKVHEVLTASAPALAEAAPRIAGSEAAS